MVNDDTVTTNDGIASHPPFLCIVEVLSSSLPASCYIIADDFSGFHTHRNYSEARNERTNGQTEKISSVCDEEESIFIGITRNPYTKRSGTVDVSSVDERNDTKNTLHFSATESTSARKPSKVAAQK